VKPGKRMPNQEMVQIDTTNILFICGGSFEGLTKIVESRVGRRSVGFLADHESSAEGEDRSALHRCAMEDLEKFGLIPEFVGRIPVIAIMDDLSVEELTQILTEPKNSFVKQYQKLFKFEKVKLTFTDEALRAVAMRAVSRKAGARGLRTVLETMMLDIMYEMPSLDNLKEVVITEDVILGTGQPELAYVCDAKMPG
jgi:ATP-dependent Clp protease ATP-binding subunit ClpX